LLALGAKNELALLQLAQRYETYLATHAGSDLGDVCFTANTGRLHGDHRLAVIGETTEQVRASLQSFIGGRDDGNVVRGKAQSKRRPKVGFSFTGEDHSVLELWKQWGVQSDPEGEPAVWVEVGPDKSDWPTLLKNLARLYVSGVEVDWVGFDRDYRRYPLVLPTYPFQRQRHWVD
jgi:acyl transferase domain-containing protein